MDESMEYDTSTCTVHCTVQNFEGCKFCQDYVDSPIILIHYSITKFSLWNNGTTMAADTKFHSAKANLSKIYSPQNYCANH